MKKQYIGMAAVAGLVLVAAIFFGTRKTEKVSQIFTEVKKGKFDVVITTTGELQAEKSVKIYAPSGLRQVRIYEAKITDMVPEGTLVDSGQYVATLDRTDISTRLKEIEAKIDELQNSYQTKQLDTTMDMQNLRDNLLNLKFMVEEKQITLDQSKFEPPATIRQNQIALDKAKRSYEQGLASYKLKDQQAKVRMLQEEMNIKQEQNNKEEILKVVDDFVIKAPSSGMVIYEKEWTGNKRKVGSKINAWDLTVATLPDFSSMVSKTYINEIDFNKVKKGQKVKIGIDAFPNQRYTGEIVELANIGEQVAGGDAKVFEVTIKLDRIDSILRPSMTTSNSIFAGTYDNVMYLPHEAVHTNDSVSYVYTSTEPIKKQIVITGESNDNEIIILKGLKENQKVYLSLPDNHEKIPYIGLELIPEIKKLKAERKKQEEEERAKKKREEKEKREQPKNVVAPVNTKKIPFPKNLKNRR